jgi:hypothetical protein
MSFNRWTSLFGDLVILCGLISGAGLGPCGSLIAHDFQQLGKPGISPPSAPFSTTIVFGLEMINVLILKSLPEIVVMQSKLRLPS